MADCRASSEETVNPASLPPDVEIAAGWDAYDVDHAGSRAVTDTGTFGRGFQKPGDVENRLGFWSQPGAYLRLLREQ
jgi:hypothetical protein